MIDINNRIGNLKRKLTANKSKLGDRGTPQPQRSEGKARSVTGEDMIDINNLKHKLKGNKYNLGDRGTPQPQRSGTKAKARSVTGEEEPSGAGSSKDGMEI